MLGFGRIGWLVGYALASLVTAVISVRILEAVLSPFLQVKSLFSREQ